MERVVAEVAGERLVIRVKELRGDRTLSEVATRTGIRQDDLGRIERGETQSIRFETVLKLCTAFDVSPSELFKVEFITPRRGNPLERVLISIEAGTVQTHQPAQRMRKLQSEELIMDLTEAAEFSDFEEPEQPRARTRVPAGATR